MHLWVPLSLLCEDIRIGLGERFIAVPFENRYAALSEHPDYWSSYSDAKNKIIRDVAEGRVSLFNCL